jgi:hypothetical protein
MTKTGTTGSPAYLNQPLYILHGMLFSTASFGKEDSHVVAGLQFNLCLYLLLCIRVAILVDISGAPRVY